MLASTDLKNKLARFADCKLDCNSGYLEIAGKQQSVEPLIFQFLLLLIRQQGEVVSKKSVIDELWPERTPTDEALRAMVKKAREALKDDARNPTYIKTIPTKGYLLIPNVDLSSTIVQTWFQSHKKLVILLGLLVTLALILLYSIFWSNSNADKTALEARVKKSEIAQLNDNKVSTYFINGTLKNVYTTRDASDSLNTIIIEEIASKAQLNLAFNDAELGDFWWSANSHRLLVMRNSNAGFYSIQFNSLNNQPTITQYNTNLPEEFTLMALNHSGNFAFIKNDISGELSLFNLGSGEITEMPEIKRLLSGDDGLVRGDLINVWPSPVSSKIILIVQYNDDAKLVLMDLAGQSQNLGQDAPVQYTELSSQRIPSNIRNGVWDKDGSKFSFADEAGALFSYQTVSNKITSWNTGGEIVNGLVADCGESCFIVSNTQGLPKLALLNNPYELDDAYAQMITSNRRTRNEFLPQYFSNGLYFMTFSELGYKLIYRGLDNIESIVYAFGMQNKVSELVVDEEQEKAVGLLNNRPFLFNLISQKLEYLNITFPDASDFMFATNNTLTFFANPPNQASGRYQYDLGSKQIALIAEGVHLEYPLNLVLATRQDALRVRAKLQIDLNHNAELIFRDERENIALGRLPNACSSCIRVFNNFLYTIDNANEPVLIRINLSNGQREQIPLRLADVIRDFSISLDGKTLALTVRQNLQTSLMRIEGFTQVY